MNPIPVNSANIVQFGFSSQFVLESSTLVFDTSVLTIYKPGGAANVIGISFQVIDPSGSYLSLIDWTNPAIIPSSGNLTYTVDLSGYPSMFGWYDILGTIRDQGGQDYSITIRVQICKPANFNNGDIDADLNEIIDCTIPKVGITDNTNYSYNNQLPVSIVKNGTFYYPQGTLTEIPFSYTPFAVYGSGKVYTGTYTVRMKSQAVYDMGNQVSVLIAYTASYEFTVTCTSSLCSILCCIEKLQDIIINQCNTSAATQAQNKLNQATIPLIMAITQEKCGVPSDAITKELLNTLDCDCQCDGMGVEAVPVFTSLSPTVLNGQCGTNAFYDTQTGTWIIRSQTITITQIGTQSQALTISQSQTECNVAWNLSIDLTVLTGEILDTIAHSDTYLALFNSLVVQTGLDLSELGQNCVINVTQCDYSLTIDASNVNVMVSSIVIDGLRYGAPSLSVTNAIGIAAWLNSLGKGTWTAIYDSGTQKTVIATNDNASVIGPMAFTLNGVSLTYAFTKSCGSILAVIKAILNYLCGLTDSQVRISQPYAICTLQADGTVSTTTISAANGTVATVLSALSVSLCTSMANILNHAGVTCAAIKAAFSNTAGVVNPTLDVLYGTRGATTTVAGQCGPLSFADLATALFTYMVNTNDTDVIALFCQVKDRCSVPVCNPVQAATIELIQPCPGIASITGAFTI
jgi:hypothetical protein